MVWTEFHYFSNALGIQATANVLLPEPAERKQMGGRPIPTLYLLHGLSDDHTCWTRMTSIERYARKYYVAVVMPAVNRSFYTDMAQGAKYFTFISEELPGVMESYFPLDQTREGRFAAGLSMGGYGALKLGLRLPERYQAVGSFSGPLEIQEIYQALKSLPERLPELDAIFGSEKALREGKDNLRNLADALCYARSKAPKMYISCGTEDSLLAPNDTFVQAYQKTLPMEYRRVPGDHTWDVWDGEVERFLRWLPLEKLDGVW